MNIADVMTQNVEFVAPNDTLETVAKKMKALDIGSLPVCDGDNLVGIITDRDIILRSIAEGKDPTLTKVSDIMSSSICFCYEDCDLNEVIKLMEGKQIRRVPILNRQEKLVGIISLGDMAVDGNNTQIAGSIITQVSEPSQPKNTWL